MPGGELTNRIKRALDAFPIVDPHSHIDPASPVCKTLDDILGYHYYTELAHSAGMDKAPLAPDVDPLDRAKALARFLPLIANTEQYRWLLFIVRRFLGLDVTRVDETNIEQVWGAAKERFAAPDWQERLIQETRLNCIFLTNDFDDPLQGFDTAFFVPCLRTDDLVFKLGDERVRERLARATNVEVKDLNSLREALARVFQNFVDKGARACAVSLPPAFAPEPVSDVEAARALDAVLRLASPSAHAVQTTSKWVFWLIAELCDDFNLPFDLMIGVRRAVYRDGVFQGQDLLDVRWSLMEYATLFNSFPRVAFPVSVLSHVHNQELVAFAWIFPNVLCHGHWWYSNVPAFLEPDLRARLTAVPRSKQIGYYSDAYRLEFVLPKFDMYRRCLARLLAEEFITERGWSEEEALELAWVVLVENPCRVFGVPLPARPPELGGSR